MKLVHLKEKKKKGKNVGWIDWGCEVGGGDPVG